MIKYSGKFAVLGPNWPTGFRSSEQRCHGCAGMPSVGSASMYWMRDCRRSRRTGLGRLSPLPAAAKTCNVKFMKLSGGFPRH